MEKVLRFVGIVLILLLIIAGAAIIFVNVKYPAVGPAPELKVKATPEMIERGKYLATHVAVCIDCHSTRDWSKLSGPIVPGTEGKGGEVFPPEFGFPGTFYSKNITPAALSSWTDGEIYRAITSGVSKDGKAFFPVMPYMNYNKMDSEDIYAIIAYIRTLHPVENAVPESKPDFPVSLLLKTIPEPANPEKRPNPSDTLVYGRYMFTVASCQECHTPMEKGKPVEGMFMAGGNEFQLPGGAVVRSSNLTPDKETGIGNMSKETFIKRFKYYINPEVVSNTVQPGGFNTIMPWVMYSGMTEEDLGAIYTYIQSLPPIKNKVEKFTPAK
ncbi:MAG TPA: c-type cytochrome [Cytophagaceae bacterium]